MAEGKTSSTATQLVWNVDPLGLVKKIRGVLVTLRLWLLNMTLDFIDPTGYMLYRFF